ncbi:MAG: ribonuclease P protein component [Alteromonas macleodii]|jgi:ribonuclease P protein component
MTSSEGNLETAKALPVAASLRLTIMKIRANFIAASKAKYRTSASLTVQVRDRNDGDDAVRVGFTCSKKVGNAVARNRAKRRLREIARLDLPHLAKSGHDYVLIGKRAVTANRDFKALRAEFAKTLSKLG